MLGAQRIVSGSEDNTLRVWDVKSGECKQVVNPTCKAASMCVLPQAKKLAIACNDSLVRVWNFQPLQVAVAEGGAIARGGRRSRKNRSVKGKSRKLRNKKRR
jgi:WD40 repeat protein